MHALSGHYPELTIAGAHSDVGGGYSHFESEKKDVANKYYYPFNWALTLVKKELLTTLLSKKWRPLAGCLTYSGSDWWHSVATNQRFVKGHLQFIAFLAMLKVAEQCGCVFSPDYKKYEDIIPEELNEYCKQVLSAAQDVLNGQCTELDTSLIEGVMPEYVHLSSTWATVLEMFGEMPKDPQMMECRTNNVGENKKKHSHSMLYNFWPYRPEEGWQRKIFD